MAYAAYCDHFQSLAEPPRAARAFVTMVVTTACPSGIAARQAITECEGCGVLRCIPDLQEGVVHFEVRLPGDMCDALMHSVLCAVPEGTFGRIVPWSAYVAAHRHDRRYVA